MSVPPTFETTNALPEQKVDSLGVLLREHRQVCWGFLMARMRHYADAEDALQETWIRAHKAWPGYREQGQFRAWILQIARREALRIQRRNQKRYLEEPPWKPVPLSSPDQHSEQQDEVSKLHEAIAELPDHQREAVWLRIVEECSFREISRIQRVPQGTSITRVRRGLAHLRKRLQGDSV